MPHVLPPKPAGTLAALNAAPAADVVVFTHTGHDELLDIVQRRTATTIFITHDIEEAVFLGDRVVVMSARPGRIAHIQDLPFGRPRDRSLMTSPTFTGIVRDLREMLRHEPTNAGAPEGAAAL